MPNNFPNGRRRNKMSEINNVEERKYTASDFELDFGEKKPSIVAYLEAKIDAKLEYRKAFEEADRMYREAKVFLEEERTEKVLLRITATAGFLFLAALASELSIPYGGRLLLWILFSLPYTYTAFLLFFSVFAPKSLSLLMLTVDSRTLGYHTAVWDNLCNQIHEAADKGAPIAQRYLQFETEEMEISWDEVHSRNLSYIKSLRRSAEIFDNKEINP